MEKGEHLDWLGFDKVMKAALYVKSDASKREQGVIFDVDAISVIGLSAQEKFYLPAILLVGEKKHILTL